MGGAEQLQDSALQEGQRALSAHVLRRSRIMDPGKETRQSSMKSFENGGPGFLFLPVGVRSVWVDSGQDLETLFPPGCWLHLGVHAACK